MKRLASMLSAAVLLATAAYCHADVYKCRRAGQVFYQQRPCKDNSETGKLDIAPQTQAEKAIAREKLQAVRRQFDAGKAAAEQARAAQGEPAQQVEPESPPVRRMYTFGNPLNEPADPDVPVDPNQPVQIIYPWGNPRHQPEE